MLRCLLFRWGAALTLAPLYLAEESQQISRRTLNEAYPLSAGLERDRSTA